MKRRTEIKIKIERSLLISQLEREVTAWCVECAAQVRLLRPEEAAVAARVSPRTIYRWVEAGQLHFSEMPNGLLLICLASLARERDQSTAQVRQKFSTE
jgi:hypothetical protein